MKVIGLITADQRWRLHAAATSDGILLKITSVLVRQIKQNTNQSFCALNHVFDLSPAVDCGDPTADLQRASLSPLPSTDTTFQSIATVTCDLGYTFQGQRSRSVQCSASGDWVFLDDIRGNGTSEVLTDCQRKFVPR